MLGFKKPKVLIGSVHVRTGIKSGLTHIFVIILIKSRQKGTEENDVKTSSAN